MNNPEFHDCPDCGYRWRHGQHGGHSCIERLRPRIERLEDERDELVSALKSLDECYCQVGYETSWDDRINHRKTLIHVRDLIKRIEGGAA